MDIHKTLHEIFSFQQFLPGQKEVIERLVTGKSALALFPTGQGKSLCYQLTALHLPGLTLVVSPLMALMKDQVDFLQEKNINASRLDSSLSLQEYNRVRSDITSGRLKLLYVAPERFANERFLADLTRTTISMIVIDEAHCISEWGHNFRPDYLKLSWFTTTLKIPVSLCLTATATPRVAKDICNSFSIGTDNFIHTGFYRENLTLRFSPSSNPQEKLTQRLTQRQPGATIVYVTLQATAEEVAENLAEQGYDARPYHAGLHNEVRKDVQEWFMASDQAIVVATIAFGMGIDKPDIRYVYHYNLPKSLENYTQEIGRAGRDGQQAICELLGNSRDLIVLENFSYGDTPDSQAIHNLTKMILGQPDHFSVSISELSHRYDMRPLVINTLLTYLELEKVLISTGPFYSIYKFIPNTSSQEIFARFDNERVAFLQDIFSSAQKAKKWFSLDLDEVMEKTASSRKRIISALTYLEEIGDIELQASGRRKGYKKLHQPVATEEKDLTVRLQNKFRTREKHDIKRLASVVNLIGHADCQTGFLLEYFGEQLSNICGHCEICLSGESKKHRFQAQKPTSLKLVESTLEMIDDFQAEIKEHSALNTTRQLARFFCGLTSPKMSRAGLRRHSAFGILADQPFALVKQWLDERI